MKSPEYEVYEASPGVFLKVQDNSPVDSDIPRHMTGGRLYIYSPEEVIAHEADLTEKATVMPIRDWEVEMRQKDAELMADARAFEDLFNWAIGMGYTPPQGSTIGTMITDRVTHRANRPI